MNEPESKEKSFPALYKKIQIQWEKMESSGSFAQMEKKKALQNKSYKQKQKMKV